MRDLLGTLDAWERDGAVISRAVVVRTFGSSPRREGATMLRADDGRVAGSVSGGCVEGATAEHMAAALSSGEERVVRFGISDSDAWDVGLACGGTIDVLVQPAVPAAALRAARESARDPRASRVVVTPGWEHCLRCWSAVPAAKAGERLSAGPGCKGAAGG